MAVNTLNDLSKCLNLLKAPKNFLEEADMSGKLVMKQSYDLLKSEEKQLALKVSKDPLNNMYIKNIDVEQIWQQIELQNQVVIPISKKFTTLADQNVSNLCVKIARLCNSVIPEENENTDEGVETGDESDSEIDTVSENDDLSPNESDGNISENEVKSTMPENEGDASDDFDVDGDHFDDLVLESGEESDSDENKDDQIDLENSDNDSDDDSKVKNKVGKFDNKDENDKINAIKSKEFRKSEVDTTFFNLRESEWIADNDIIGRDNDDIDFMHDSDSESDENDVMYNQFFDPPNDTEGENFTDSTQSEKRKKSNPQVDKKISAFGASPNRQVDKKISAFGASPNRQVDYQKNIEHNDYMAEKPWFLKGEVGKEQRPENSALEEALEYTVAVRLKPIITEDTTKCLENLVLSRIKNKSWDDVEKKIKPQLDPYAYKQKLILDQEKSKKSLDKIYEEEYIKLNTTETKSSAGSILLTSEEKQEELPAHKEIKSAMDKIFAKLDAISNFHYTPKIQEAEIKVVSNLPSITVEESTPTIASDATLLAPQEVIAPTKGDLKSEREKTKTDKLRQRKSKKKHQKMKAHREEKKLKEQLNKKSGKIDAQASIKVVEKAFKKGQVKALDSEQNSLKSTAGFFTQLQQTIDNKNNNKNKRKLINTDNKRSKKSKTLNMTKLLL